ncbi:P-loop containing nucleoside triphosphate hydrolase protein, partial [Tribonema minus]
MLMLLRQPTALLLPLLPALLLAHWWTAERCCSAAGAPFRGTVRRSAPLRSAMAAAAEVIQSTIDVLLGKGITHFTPVQAVTYEHILAGRDMIAKSRTGTGKTIAFGLPVIQHLARFADDADSRSSKRYAAPLMRTYHLATNTYSKVADELAQLAQPHGMSVECFYGGASYGPQESALRRGVDVVVGTPGRLIDHVQKGNLDLSELKHAVLDEADEMLNMGFADAIEELFARVNIPECQVLLFSATVPDWVRRISAAYLKNPLQVDAVGTTDNRLATTVKHLAIETPSRNRAHMLEDVIAVYGKGSRAIVFTQTKRECDELAAGNAFKTLSSQVLHGDIGQNQREVTIGQFRKGQFQVLVATDVAARGIDISEIDLVVQYRPPTDPDTYVHRSGRTGRAGRLGTCVTLFADNERRDVQKIEKAIGKGFKFERAAVPSATQVMEVAGKVALKALDTVSADVVPFFTPAARELLAESQADGAELDTEQLLARCLAAIARKTEIQQRSILTGEPDMATVQMVAHQPMTTGDVTFAVNKLARAGGGPSPNIGKIAIGKDAHTAVFDMTQAAAAALIDVANDQELKAIKFTLCTELPELSTQEYGGRPSRGRFDRGGDRGYGGRGG